MATASFEYKTVIVAVSEIDINAAMTAQVADGWMFVSLTASGADIIILFMRTIPAS